MGDYGIQVSEPGDDVLGQVYDTARFSTKYSTLKVYMSGNASFTTDGSGVGSVEIPHDLDYAPAFYAFNKRSYQDTFFEATTYTNCFFTIGGIFSEFDIYSTADVLHIGGTGLSNNTTYYFRYFILVDLAEAFSGTSGIVLSNDYGFKVSKPGIDVLTGKEYEMAYSSKYKSLQFFKESFKSETMDLPGFSASVVDTDVRAGTYVDFTHGLKDKDNNGYPPFFLAFYNDSSFMAANTYREIPFSALYGNDVTQSDIYAYSDSTRVRVIANNYASYPLATPATARTYTIKLYVFTENLNG